MRLSACAKTEGLDRLLLALPSGAFHDGNVHWWLQAESRRSFQERPDVAKTL